MLFKNVGGFFVSNFYNVLYLTGFKGLNPEEREAFAILTSEKIFLVTDGRHDLETLKVRNPTLEIRALTAKENLVFHLKKIIKEEKIRSLGFESEDLKFLEFKRLKKALKQVRLRPAERYLLKKREIKSADEIEKIRRACEIADRCLREIIKTIKIGQTEGKIAKRIEFWFKENNYDVSFYPIVAVDENSAIPHYDTKANGKNKIKKGSIILIDYGAKVRDYCSDITRVLFMKGASPEALNIYSKLLKCQEETIKSIGRGIKTKEIDQKCRKLLRAAKLPDFPHSTGHGVGLEVHEDPKISRKAKEKVRPGQVFTVEPGVYIPKKFGFRIEDTLVIDKDSKPRILTQFPKKPPLL